ncbi:radical SAM protein [Streptomyces pactum]|uniref:Radical SAM protein n=1 Tax=Streptomyces pactum TaxID=68249 RepID=A0ABS0NFQ3_9ACTN|nr:radical SAM protein [Streptomyces pactum]MBH5334026.1 radical SAM protein [Streptomyces pactum]
MTVIDTAQPAVDWTALHNFDALRGQLRVSLTPRCNIACWFCHNEGDVPPPATRADREQQPRSRVLEPAGFVSVITTLMDAGLKRVYFTGGEPLTSPHARPVLEQLPAAKPGGSYTLITNGTHVRTHRSWLGHTPVNRAKVSLHYFSDESFRAIAQTRLGIATVLQGIETARELFETVELNCLLLKENEHEVRSIVDFAVERRLPVQFIELVGTDFNSRRAGCAVPADAIVKHLRTLTRHEHTNVAGVGQGRRIFLVDGIRIEVIHRNLGRHHVGQCGTCPVRKRCVEGFWALRLGHDGGLQPCLLREDLRMHVTDLLHDPQRLAEAVADHVTAFTEGVL